MPGGGCDWQATTPRSKTLPAGTLAFRELHDGDSVFCTSPVRDGPRGVPAGREALPVLHLRGMALPRSQEDGRLEEPPACREDGRHLARRVHRLLRTHRGPPRPHHFPEGPFRQGELLERDEVPALCWHRGAGRHTIAGVPARCRAFLQYASIRSAPLSLTRL